MTTQIVGAPGLDRDIANGDLVLRWYDSDHTDVAVEARIPAQALLTFLRDVVNSGSQCLAWSISNIASGQCDTCHNTRMVDEPRPNRKDTTWRVHCPDCTQVGAEQAMHDMPRVVPSGFRPAKGA